MTKLAIPGDLIDHGLFRDLQLVPGEVLVTVEVPDGNNPASADGDAGPAPAKRPPAGIGDNNADILSMISV
jgi:hypothetical protein